MKNKKGLVISWYFPPINSSEGMVTFKLLKNSKYEYDVITQNISTAWTYGNKENELTSENINIISLGKKDEKIDDASKIRNWVEESISYIEKNIQNYDFIMSRSMPPESHEIALYIKNKYPEIKWIASFGDPIANNPYNLLSKKHNPFVISGNQLGFRQILSPIRIMRKYIWNYRERRNDINIQNEKFEREIFSKADKIIFNNSYQEEYMTREYSDDIKEKALILPHSFDEKLYSTDLNKSDKFKITYLGHLDIYRNVSLFLKALNRIKENTNLLDDVEISFYGNMSVEDKAKIIDYELTDIVKFKKPVKYLESLKIMQESDLLLLFDANLTRILDKNIFFAAKLADYIGSNKQIFGITMLDGPSSDILRKVGAYISTYSYDDIYNKLIYILTDKKIVDKKLKNRDEFNAKNVAKIYDEEVKKM